MKKVLITLIAAFAAISANAQFYVGGSFRFSSNPDADVSSFKLAPEIGYDINDAFSVGLAMALRTDSVAGYSARSTSFNPYVRYAFANVGGIRFFADGGLVLTTAKNSDGAWKIGIFPGFAIPVNDSFSFVAHLGELSFDSSSTFILGLDNSVSAGLYFHF